MKDLIKAQEKRIKRIETDRKFYTDQGIDVDKLLEGEHEYLNQLKETYDLTNKNRNKVSGVPKNASL